MSSYRNDMVARFWRYQKQFFPQWEEYFERPEMPNRRPPVFLKECVAHNLLFDPCASPIQRKQLLSLIPPRERHRWFASMTSSQALALSVFGNLKINGCLGLLREVRDQEGRNVFGEEITTDNFHMEYKVDSLGEPRPTSLDAFIDGKEPIAIECKLTEMDVGHCSRPMLTQRDSNYEADYCDGTYFLQRDRKTRCSLTEIGVRYWQYVPGIFKWSSDIDMTPCPLRSNYQLVRNLLAISFPGDGMPSGNGHIVLVYDDRNPAFQKGGRGYVAYGDTKNALHEPEQLKRCSWQQIAQVIEQEKRLEWLGVSLQAKYGI